MSTEAAYATAGLALCLLCVASLIPSAWDTARRRLDLLLDAEADEAMAAACDREWLARSETPEFDRLSMEFFAAALGDETRSEVEAERNAEWWAE